VPGQDRLLGGAAQFDGPLRTRVSTTLPLLSTVASTVTTPCTRLRAGSIGINDAAAVYHGAAGIHSDSGTIGTIWGARPAGSGGDKPACQGHDSQPGGQRRRDRIFDMALPS
jgi:hypothetical protein